ncbi:hypothetical protein LCGC14_1944340 [marine sediment metagenome]|uniref:Uncharacterized protein n=1 Tax=marine sediment metagenome TaxID=412755 RepID=A0A0F9IGG9_9ZZZZ
MLPRDQDVRNLAIYAPRLAYAMIIGVPRVPFIADIPIQFSSSTVNAPSIDQSFNNNLTQDTMIERVSFNVFQQNSFPGSPFQSLYFNQLKQSGQIGVGIQMQVFGGPKYAINDLFTDLGTLADVFAMTWPQGWPLAKQSNVRVIATLTQTPVSVPYNILISFLGWQLLDKSVEDLSDAEARSRLRKLGFESPDLASLLKP